MRCFARVRRQAWRSRGEAAPWREVLAHGAPKALGDVFLAAVAAVALDRGNLQHAMDILREHVRYCSALRDLPTRQEVEPRTLAETPDTEFNEALELAGPVLDRAAVKAELRGSYGKPHPTPLPRGVPRL